MAVVNDLSTKDRLIEAAISLIESEGESAVRVDQVVALAGFTKPVLYSHFTDKDDVIVQAQALRYRRSLEWPVGGMDELTASSTTREEFEARLAQIILGFDSPQSREQRRIRNEVVGSSVSRPALRVAVVSTNRGFVSWLVSMFERWKANGWIEPRFSLPDIAEWWAVQVHGRYVVEVDRDDRESSEWVAVTLSAGRHLLGLTP